MSELTHTEKQAKASKNLRGILLAKKLSVNMLARMINEAKHKVSQPTVGTWIAFPLKMNHKESTVVAQVLQIPAETMDAILRGDDIVTTVSITIEKKGC